MTIITPTAKQRAKIERWLAIAKRKSVCVVDDTMIAIRNLDRGPQLEILVIGRNGVCHKGIYDSDQQIARTTVQPIAATTSRPVNDCLWLN